MLIRFVAALTVLLSIVCASPAFADCGPDQSCWGALAAGTWHDDSGNAHVAIGSSVNYSSEIRAKNAAMSQCNELGYNCGVVDTFSNGGCGFITTGSTDDTVRWNSGSDINDVYNTCIADGYNCDWPIGACTADR
jgi:hypothetical protein